MKLLTLYKLLKIDNWIKNILVFVPLVFGMQLFHKESFYHAFWGFLCFDLISSVGYIINGIVDAEVDKKHPIKRYRPIASGQVQKSVALNIAAFIFAISLVISFWLPVTFRFVMLLYLLNTLFYTVKLKQYIFIDILVVAVGFVLRVIAGSFAIGVQFSDWLLVITFFLAIFLSIGKRYHELILLGEDAGEHRMNLNIYTTQMLNFLLNLAAALIIISYAIYSLDASVLSRFGNNLLIYSLPLVIYGVFRYIYLVFNKVRGGDPIATIYQDKPMLVTIIFWGIYVVGIIYLK